MYINFYYNFKKQPQKWTQLHIWRLLPKLRWLHHTCHTCFLPRVTCYLLLVTCYLPPVTCHLLLATCYLIPVTCYILFNISWYLQSYSFHMIISYLKPVISCKRIASFRSCSATRSCFIWHEETFVKWKKFNMIFHSKRVTFFHESIHLP